MATNKILKSLINNQIRRHIEVTRDVNLEISSNTGKPINDITKLKPFKPFNPADPIPKILHLCYKNKNIPEYVISTWQKLNPEYKINFYDDTDCINFLRENYGNLYVDIFNFIPDGPIKADFFRICVIYRLGGIYCDIDIEPLVPFNEFIERDVMFLTCVSASRNQLNPHIIMANKYDPIIKSCIDTYIQYYTFKTKYSYWVWSIVYIMRKHMCIKMKKYINNDCIIIDENGNKFQFIKEIGAFPNMKSFYCVYNNKRILNNRYDSYNSNKHTF